MRVDSAITGLLVFSMVSLVGPDFPWYRVSGLDACSEGRFRQAAESFVQKHPTNYFVIKIKPAFSPPVQFVFRESEDRSWQIQVMSFPGGPSSWQISNLREKHVEITEDEACQRLEMHVQDLESSSPGAGKALEILEGMRATSLQALDPEILGEFICLDGVGYEIRAKIGQLQAFFRWNCLDSGPPEEQHPLARWSISLLELWRSELARPASSPGGPPSTGAGMTGSLQARGEVRTGE